MNAMDAGNHIAVLLMAYGTPRTREDIEPYYTDIRRGRAPTPEQLAIFQNLPPETQKQLLDEMLKEQDQTPSSKTPAVTAENPEPEPVAVKTEDLNLRIRPKFEGDIVLRGGDSVLVQLAIAERPYTGPASTEPYCRDTKFSPVNVGPGAFIAVDQLSACRITFKERPTYLRMWRLLGWPSGTAPRCRAW